MPSGAVEQGGVGGGGGQRQRSGPPRPISSAPPTLKTLVLLTAMLKQWSPRTILLRYKKDRILREGNLDIAWYMYGRCFRLFKFVKHST